jgi:hypothetical protein
VPIYRRVIRYLFALLLLAVSAGISYFTIANSDSGADRDSTEYWASARLLLNHANPYDKADIVRLEMQAGTHPNRTRVMFNPPCVLALILPLGLLPPHAAIFLWSLMMVGALVLAVRILWNVHGQPPGRYQLLAYVFAPVLAAVTLGQAVILVLLGIALFLRFHQTRPFLAGLCFLFLSVKPHLLLPFGVVALLWALRGRRFTFLLGAGAAVAVSLALPWFLDPGIFAQYIPVLHSAGSLSNGMPNLSGLLHRIDPDASYLQYVLSLSAIASSVWLFLRRGNAWNWNHEGLLVIALSVLVAPYSWFSDELLMFPAILAGIYRLADSNRSIAGFGVLNCAALGLVLFDVPLFTGAYEWTGLAWLGWAVFSLGTTRTRAVAVQAFSASNRAA